MRRHPLTAAAAGLLLTGVLAGPTSAGEPIGVAPAAGGFEDEFTTIPLTVNGDYIPLVGTFCRPAPEPPGLILWYAPGPAADSLWALVGEEADGLEVVATPMTVNGVYDPVVGDFDGNGCTDVLWYGPGSAPDSIWYGEEDGTFTAQPLAVNGTYTPVTGSFDAEPDGCECTDVFWYSTDGGAERIWLGGADRTFTSAIAPQVAYSGYRVTKTDNLLVFHRPGPGADYVWHDVQAGDPIARSQLVIINGDYVPYSLGGPLLLYAPGPATDRIAIDIAPDGTLAVLDGSINGSYRLGRVAGDRAPAFLLFHGPGTAPDSIWILGDASAEDAGLVG